MADEADQPDLVFKFIPRMVGGLATRYNPVSGLVEPGFEPSLTASMPLLLGPHISAFDDKPDLARTTTGDIAAFPHQAPITATSR